MKGLWIYPNENKGGSMLYKPHNFAQLTPCLAVRDGAKAINF
jgi:hypothetical protein